MKKWQFICSFLIIGILYFFYLAAFAAIPGGGTRLPSTVKPESIQRSYDEPPLEAAPTGQALPQQPKGAPPPSAQSNIKFKLVRIALEGNTVYTYDELEPLWHDKLNKTISVTELFQIVEDITNFYRNHGYILSRAILPPQHVENGVVVVRIIEGFIQNVNVIGTPRGARYLVEAYGRHIAEDRPARVQSMEYYLLLANEIPATSVRAVLSPSKTTVGASDLNLATYNKLLTGYFSYDNYGTRYVGPQEDTGSIQANSFFRSGDVTSLTYGTTPKPRELRYYDVSYNTPLGTEGLRWILDTNDAKTQPLYILAPLKINGDARTYSSSLQYPVIRSQTQSLTFDAGFYYFDSQVLTINNELLYRDHIRPIQLGLTYTFTDRFRGNNLITFRLREGLNFLGATDNTSPTAQTSRPGGQANFTKFTLQASRLQQLFWRLSLFGVFQGQYTLNPLLASEQFAYGGSQLGRGYDSAEIIGDRGMAGSLEMRVDFFPGYILLQTLELYGFYDAGVIWNIKFNPGVKMKSSATSTGCGMRFSLLKYIYGNLMVAQPLTKQVAALDQVNQGIMNEGRRPRIFFSITAQYN